MKYLFFIMLCFFSSLFAEENQIILDGSSLNRIKNPFNFLEPKSNVVVNSISKQIVIPVETDLSDRASHYALVPKEFVINNSELENILKIFLDDKRNVSYKNISIELLSANINILFDEFEDHNLYTLSDVILDLELKIIKDGVSTIHKSSMNKKLNHDVKDISLSLTIDDFETVKINEAINKEFEYSIFTLLSK